MMLILGAGVLVSAVVVASSVHFANMQTQLMRQRDRVYGIQMLQEFAMLAQKAHDNWLDGGLAVGTCPGGQINFPAAGRFCWSGASLAPSPTICLKHPSNGSNVCMNTGAAGAMTVATLDFQRIIEPFDDLKDRFRHLIENHDKLIAMFKADVFGRASNWAYAVAGMDAFIPELTGAPTNDITNPVCNGTTVSDYCKVCTAGTGNVTCLEIRVCLDTTCSNTSPFARYYRQRIGLFNRAI